jgi:hypothetical protein
MTARRLPHEPQHRPTWSAPATIASIAAVLDRRAPLSLSSSHFRTKCARASRGVLGPVPTGPGSLTSLIGLELKNVAEKLDHRCWRPVMLGLAPEPAPLASSRDRVCHDAYSALGPAHGRLHVEASRRAEVRPTDIA